MAIRFDKLVEHWDPILQREFDEPKKRTIAINTKWFDCNKTAEALIGQIFESRHVVI